MAKLSKVNKFTIDGMNKAGLSLQEMAKTLGKTEKSIQEYLNSLVETKTPEITEPDFYLDEAQLNKLKEDFRSTRYTIQELVVKYNCISVEELKLYMTKNKILQPLERDQNLVDGFVHHKHGVGGATIATQMSSILGDESRKQAVPQDTRISRGSVYNIKEKKIRGE